MNDNHSPIITIKKDIIEQIEGNISELPSDPKQIAKLAVSTGETAFRLGCCLKLFSMYRNMIPPISLTASDPLSLDRINENFEKELTVSAKLSTKSLTTVFSCLIAAIGVEPLRKYLASPSSINPFVQCLRATFRLTWMLRCRYLTIRGLREMNPLAVVNNSLRLCSFPDFSAGAQRAALHTALKIPDRLNLSHLSYSLPMLFLSDSAKPLYEDLKSVMSEEKVQELTELEHEVMDLVARKQTATYYQ